MNSDEALVPTGIPSIRAGTAPVSYRKTEPTDTTTDTTRTRRLADLVVVALSVLGAACGGSAATSGSTRTTRVAARGLVGKRYCEVLLAHVTSSGPVATVYNTYPLNDCPESQWAALDATTIAAATGVPFVGLNGPRYWLMNSISKKRSAAEVIKTFGGITMIEEATVVLGTSVASAQVPYTPHTVSRQASFTFAAGRQVYELIGPDGTVWVMQTYSQIKDPTLSMADLPGLASRLTLPAGWTYRVRTLTRPLVVATENHPVQVLQDSLVDSYSEETAR